MWPNARHLLHLDGALALVAASTASNLLGSRLVLDRGMIELALMESIRNRGSSSNGGVISR